MSELKITVPSHQADGLTELLTASGLQFSDDRKWILRTFTVHGTPEELQALRPKLDAFHHDEMSKDAW